MEVYDTIKYRGYTINIYPDECGENPITSWDMLGTFACWHRRYNLSNTFDFPHRGDFEAFEKENKLVKFPLYLYDHSGITISLSPFSCPWDSVKVGFVFATYEKIKKEFNCKKITAKIIGKVFEVVKHEVKALDDYLTGNVYGYEIEKFGKVFDSCWGYYGNPDEKSGCIEDAKRAIDNDIEVKKSEPIGICA